MGAAPEGFAAHERRGLSGHPDREQHLAIQRALAHGVVTIVGQVERVVGTEMDPVRTVKDPVAPGAQIIAVAVEDDQRVFAAVEHVNLVPAIDGHRGDIAQAPAERQLRPVVDNAVRELAGS